jgi:NADH-quinone oxidoreductase subunit I
MNRIIKVGKKKRLSWWDRIYIFRIIEGLWGTFLRLWRKPFTQKYPEVKRYPLGGYRGIHRLNKDWQGRVKCVACYMCATVCPSKCIRIVAGKAPWPDRDKYPVEFEIDELRCIFCGFCEMACPENAINLTPIYEFSQYRREDFLLDKEALQKINEWWSLPEYSKEYIKKKEIEKSSRNSH